ncbi:MAG: xanthine dehydrogenase family protein subunit M [Acidimicrobiia bacterium]|nr:xanthine dehydrogenase family protein subunit M [Acidimicrobiia bacterium]MYC57087.1 xanthine dehydrogenase family protein subunit M [Acidimicrobiia bacterium]MYI30164.1 xanthine dehydrogenase family protein subunit M [Acidimicrobiia bacterium]
MTNVIVARSVDEALATLSEAPDITILAGGTDLMVEINRGLRQLNSVIALAQVPELHRWSIGEDRLMIGAGVTYTTMLNTKLAQAAPALAQAARTVGSPPIRNAGTLGGNLGTASPAGDTLPVLAALNASIVLDGSSGERCLSLEEFMVGVKRTCLAPGELIKAVEMDHLSGGQEYLKIGPRNAMVISMAGVALAVDRKAKQVRCALGAVAANIPRASEAEAWVGERINWDSGTGVDSVLAQEFGQRVAAESSPIDDHRSTAAYRRHAVGVLAARALQRVFSEGTNGYV